jgi:dihydrofolate reductase
VIVSIIVAVSENGGIGLHGQVPWHLSADLKLFKQVTMGHTLIQGRRTYESIGKPLPGRKMVVVTHQLAYQAPGCTVVNSLAEALEMARNDWETEAFIGGGASTYAEAIPLVDRMYFTRVHAEVEADTFFPDFDESEWAVREEVEYEADEKNEYSFTYQVLEKSQ